MDTYIYCLQCDCVTVSADDQMLELYITNISEDELLLDNVNNVDIANYPGWGEPCSDRDPIGWEFRFSYGETDGDLNTADVCNGITLSMEHGSTSWQLIKKEDNKEPYWQVIPKGKVTLKPKESLILVLGNISVNDRRGRTKLTINYKESKNPPVKAADISIKKLAKTVIKSFQAEKDKYEAKDDVKFIWELQDYDPAEAWILLDGYGVSGTSYVQQAVALERHTLQVKNNTKYIAQAQTAINFEVGLSINITGWRPGFVVVEWQTKSMENCKINGTAVDKNGSKEFPVSGDADFILTATNVLSKGKEETVAHFLMPVIEEFTIDSHGGSNQFQREGNFLSREEVYDEDGSAEVCVPYAAPGPFPPPPPQFETIIFSYKTRNATKCSLANSDYHDREASATNVRASVYGGFTSVLLEATGNYGYTVEAVRKL